MKKLFAMALACLLLALTACGGTAESVEEASAAGLFSGMDTVDIDGNAVDASVFAENDLTLVNAWSLSCDPCIREMPALEQLDQAYDNVAVLGLYLNDKTEISEQARTQIHEVLEAKGVTYPHLLTSQAMLDSPEYRDIQVTPTTFFVDSRGEIVDTLIATWTYEEWVSFVDKALKQLGAAETVAPGTIFTEMETVDMHGEAVDSSFFGENDLTLVNVWDLGCVYCIQEMPTLDQLDREYDNVAVVGLYSNFDGTPGIPDEVREEIEALYAETGASYRQLVYSQAMLNAPETADVVGFPTTYFVDSQGNIRSTVVGARNYEQWKELIDDALK